MCIAGKPILWKKIRMCTHRFMHIFNVKENNNPHNANIWKVCMSNVLLHITNVNLQAFPNIGQAYYMYQMSVQIILPDLRMKDIPEKYSWTFQLKNWDNNQNIFFVILHKNTWSLKGILANTMYIYICWQTLFMYDKYTNIYKWQCACFICLFFYPNSDTNVLKKNAIFPELPFIPLGKFLEYGLWMVCSLYLVLQLPVY